MMLRWIASDFERLDPRLFRSFLAVVRTESFSAAAQEASLTQGAISQQIAKLEDRLHTQLFVRAGQRIVTTPGGQLLAAHARAYMEHTSAFLESLNEEFESMRGQVSYAMPESCVHAPHFGWLLQRRLEYPELLLSIELKPSSDVLDDVQSGVIDFGFSMLPCDAVSMQAYPFCTVEYVLVGPAGACAPSPLANLDELLALPFVTYPDMINGLNRWVTGYFGESDALSPLALRVSGQFNDLRGVLAMIEGGMGFSVLPRHVVAAQLASGGIRLVQPQDAEPERAVRQQIWIVRRRDHRMPARVRRVIRWFLDMHTELQPVPQEFLN
ncbi:MAG: LysR family transcriptional regulator [Proteobacteria bacterium]|nr:LysR family transcriptional regulator [Pseudomonadota bacterium]